MTIFNETFTEDKIIYYPSNWETGKTAEELYLQWKLTTPYFIISNTLQCLIAGLWLCFVLVICYAIIHMWRLYNLADDNRTKIQNRQFISRSSIIRMCFIGSIAFSVTGSLCIMNEFTRYALLKGFLFCISVNFGKEIYQKVKKALLQSKQKKEGKERKQDQEKIVKQEQ